MAASVKALNLREHATVNTSSQSTSALERGEREVEWRGSVGGGGGGEDEWKRKVGVVGAVKWRNRGVPLLFVGHHTRCRKENIM